MNRHRPFLLSLLAFPVLLLVGCGPESSTQCQSDDDCSESEVCVEGSCEEDSSSTSQQSTTCSTDADCDLGTGELCIGGVCQRDNSLTNTPCLATADCPIDEYCDDSVMLCAALPDGWCRTQGQCPQEQPICTTSSENIPGTCVECTQDSDCASNECVSPGVCTVLEEDAGTDMDAGVQCGPNASLADDQCMCDPGFAADAEGACEPIQDAGVVEECPANASGAPPNCTCLSGYTWNADETACIEAPVDAGQGADDAGLQTPEDAGGPDVNITQDPAGDGYYDNNAYQIEVLQCDAGEVIWGVFTEFELEPAYDWLFLYDGESPAAPLLFQGHGSLGQGFEFQSTDRFVFLKFTSDEANNAPGYTLEWLCIDPVVQPMDAGVGHADGGHNVPDGGDLHPFILQDLGGDSYYPNGMEQWETISCPDGQFVDGMFTEFLTESPWDVLTVYDGSTDVVLFEGSGTSGMNENIQSSGSELLFFFKPDDSNSGPGFSFQWECVPLPDAGFLEDGGDSDDAGEGTDSGVNTDGGAEDGGIGDDAGHLTDGGAPEDGGHQDGGAADGGEPTADGGPGSEADGGLHSDGGAPLTDGGLPLSGVLQDPGGSDNYANNELQEETITCPSGYTVQGTFTEFETQIAADPVIVFDGTSSSDNQLFFGSGSAGLGTEVLSTGTSLHVVFTSDGTVTRPGYTFEWQCLGDGMPQTDAGSPGTDGGTPPVEGTIFDPGGPNGDYSNNAYQTELMSCSDGLAVSATLTEFNTEQNYDYLSLYDGSSSSASLLLYTSGTGAEGQQIVSSGSQMYLVFDSDSSVVRAGFRIDWSCVEPPPPGLSGSSTDPQGPNSDYANNLNHTELIVCPEGYTIDATFAVFHLEGCCDYFYLYDGSDASAPTLVNGANGTSEAGNSYSSTGRYLYLTFSSDGSVSYAGYQLNWQCVQ